MCFDLKRPNSVSSAVQLRPYVSVFIFRLFLFLLRTLQFQEDLCAGADVIGQYIRDDKAPLRQYFSSRTNLPLQDSDWDYDSDCEGSEDWLIEEKHAVSSIGQSAFFLFFLDDSFYHFFSSTCTHLCLPA